MIMSIIENLPRGILDSPRGQASVISYFRYDIGESAVIEVSLHADRRYL